MEEVKYECAQIEGDHMYVQERFGELYLETWSNVGYSTLYLSLEDAVRLRKQLKTFINSNYKPHEDTP